MHGHHAQVDDSDFHDYHGTDKAGHHDQDLERNGEGVAAEVFACSVR